MAIDYSTKRFIRWITTILLSLLGVIVLAWGANGIFTLKEIRVTGDPVQLTFDKSRLGQNMLFLPTQKLAGDILSTYPLVESVSFSKSFPSTLVVHVTLRRPVAMLFSGNHTYALDKEGIVVSEMSPDKLLPALYFDVGVLSMGSRVTDTRVKGTLGLLGALPKDIVLDSFTQSDSTTIQANLGNTNIFFAQNADFVVKAETLQTIISGFRIKGILPTVIDLRFDKPIITN